MKVSAPLKNQVSSWLIFIFALVLIFGGFISDLYKTPELAENTNNFNEQLLPEAFEPSEP